MNNWITGFCLKATPTAISVDLDSNFVSQLETIANWEDFGDNLWTH